MSLSLISGELKEYDPTINFSKPTSAFIDLATYGQLESNMYGGRRAITYFIRETKRYMWFTQIPIKLKLNTASPDFGKEFKAIVSRSGDYLMNTWLRVTLNAVSIYKPSLSYTNSTGKGSETITWTPNFMHNLIEKCNIKSNGMILDELYSEHLDFYTAFMVSKGRRVGYNRMIGNFTSPYNGLAGINVCGIKARHEPNLNTSQDLFLPLPFFFSKHPTLALPTAALPYANLEMNFKFRDWTKLLSYIGSDGKPREIDIRQLKSQTPTLSNVQVWANYAIVSNEERKMMGCNPRDMVIEQNQQIGGSYGSGKLNVNSWNETTSVELRLKHSIKAIFFGAKNQMGLTESPFRANYNTSTLSASDIMAVKISVSGSPTGFLTGDPGDWNNGMRSLNGTWKGINYGESHTQPPPINYNMNYLHNDMGDYSALYWGGPDNIEPVDPIGSAKLLYENSTRMDMESLYYSLIQPYYHAKNVPEAGSQYGVLYTRDANEVAGQAGLSIGYHMYSYSLKLNNPNPNGSTNYGVLTNASFVFTPSRTAVNSSDKTGPWNIYVSAINNNIIRISGGAIGFPLL